MSGWLQRLHALNQKDLSANSANSANRSGTGGTLGELSAPIGPIGTKVPEKFSPSRDAISFGSTDLSGANGACPPLEADGETPCGYCPTCGGGEFWRYPCFHSRHAKGDWRCLICLPIPPAAGPCDFAGVPDNLFPRANKTRRSNWNDDDPKGAA
jgi:hypothetical protein